jgi:hypothetical protein
LESIRFPFDPEAQVLFVAGRLSRGLVRYCAAVVAKMKTQMIGAALALKAGDPVETALRAALIGAVWVKYAPP